MASEAITLWRCPEHGLIHDAWHGWAECVEGTLIDLCTLCPRSKLWTEGELGGPFEYVPAPQLETAQQRIEELELGLGEARELVIRQGHTVRQWDEELSVMQGRAETAERRYTELRDAVLDHLANSAGVRWNDADTQLQTVLDRLEGEGDRG